MTQRDKDRRAALGWIAGQLAWENRLQNLRHDDPEPEAADEQVAESTETAA